MLVNKSISSTDIEAFSFGMTSDEAKAISAFLGWRPLASQDYSSLTGCLNEIEEITSEHVLTYIIDNICHHDLIRAEQLWRSCANKIVKFGSFALLKNFADRVPVHGLEANDMGREVRHLILDLFGVRDDDLRSLLRIYKDQSTKPVPSLAVYDSLIWLYDCDFDGTIRSTLRQVGRGKIVRDFPEVHSPWYVKDGVLFLLFPNGKKMYFIKDCALTALGRLVYKILFHTDPVEDRSLQQIMLINDVMDVLNILRFDCETSETSGWDLIASKGGHEYRIICDLGIGMKEDYYSMFESVLEETNYVLIITKDSDGRDRVMSMFKEFIKSRCDSFAEFRSRGLSYAIVSISELQENPRILSDRLGDVMSDSNITMTTPAWSSKVLRAIGELGQRGFADIAAAAAPLRDSAIKNSLDRLVSGGFVVDSGVFLDVRGQESRLFSLTDEGARVYKALFGVDAKRTTDS